MDSVITGDGHALELHKEIARIFSNTSWMEKDSTVIDLYYALTDADLDAHFFLLGLSVFKVVLNGVLGYSLTEEVQPFAYLVISTNDLTEKDYS